MTRGLVIPALPFLPLKERSFTGLSDYQVAVQGYIEPVMIERPRLTLYVNEEGKLQNMEVNPRATALWWLHEPEARGNDLVLGPAAVVADEEDEDALRLLALIPLERRFRVEVLTNEPSSLWQPAHHLFSDWFDAAIAALQLCSVWESVRDVRVSGA